MLALLDDRRMLLLVAAHRLNVKVVDNDLRIGKLAAYRTLGCIVHHVVGPQAAIAHLLA